MIRRLLSIIAALALAGYPQLAAQQSMSGNMSSSGNMTMAASSAAAFVIVQSCYGTTCAFGSNVGSGHALVFIAKSFLSSTLSGTASGTGSGCTGSFTVDTPVNAAASSGTQATSTATANGPCTVTFTSSSGVAEVLGVEISGWNGTYDTRGSWVDLGGGVTNISCPAVTTTVSGDYVLCLAIDDQNSGGTYSGTGGFAIAAQNNTFGIAIGDKVQTAAGSITGTMIYSNSSGAQAGTITLEP